MSDTVHDDAEVLLRWLHELATPTPDAAVVASLEDTAEEHGWHPYDAWQALTAAKWSSVVKKAVGGFNPDLHPRGRDGQFIESGGTVRLEGNVDTGGGKQFDATGLRGQVDAIIPDPKSPGNPTIRVRVSSPDGKRTAVVDVKPAQVTAAPEKARLDRSLSQRTDEMGDLEPGLARPPQRPQGELERLRGRQREEAGRARTTSDEELAAELTTAGPLWRQAIEREQANRLARRAEIDADRQALIDSINEAAANLSTTDAEERAVGLDKILAKLRFSKIDTNQVHDHIYPPGESGRWTAERAAQHEAMWQELLANVEAAGIPQDKDALVLGGLPGAGKSFSLKPGQKADRFGVTSWEPNKPVPESGATHVSVNPDIVKEMLIDRGMLPAGISPDLKPLEQVTFIHEESSYLGKLFSERLGRLGYNVVLDNTYDSPSGMENRMTPLARKGYKFRGLFVDIPVEESLASAKKRYIDSALSERGGRFVPSSVNANRASTQGTMSKNRDAFDTHVGQDWFTDWAVIDNTGINNRTPLNEITAEGTGAGSAAGAYLPNNDKALPKQGPRLPTPAEAAPTITV